MRASHEWLRGFVPHSLSPAEVERLISTHVATVDSVESLRADLSAFVVARVVQAGAHPDSDHLWVTKVDDGSGTLLDVVCGAPNVVVNTLYPFARSGTVMPSGLKIERRKIRGEVSNGMLCSPRELGLGDEHSGIMALDIDVPPGTPLLDAMPIGDVRYEIDVLPNRPDLLSHVGLARELSALAEVPMQTPPELSSARERATSSNDPEVGGKVSVTLENETECPRYGAAVIRGVKVGPSPDWLRARVESVGSRSISNVVDITNYFLHAYGQPMHAFDLERVDGWSIVVRRAKAEEKLTTLDGVDRALTSEMLVIADASGPIGVAGVMGGRDSEVTETTTDVLLEVASFDPQRVRKGRRALGLNTDASHRFERGVDPALPQQLTRMAAELIAEVCGGTVERVDVHGGGVAAHKAVELRPARVSRLLGAQVSGDEIASLLARIGFGVMMGGPDSFSVTAPSWRHDVSRDVDLIEEIARLRGYNTLSDDITPFRPSVAPDAPLFEVTRRVRDALVSAGFAELHPLPFVKGDDSTHVRVTNPLADDEPHLRTRILDTLARRAEYNLSRRQGNLRLFEIGSVFHPVRDTVSEEIRVGVLLMGARRPGHFTESAPASFDAWDAKALALDIAKAIAPTAKIEVQGGEGNKLWTLTRNTAKLGAVSMVSLDAPPWAAAAFGIEMVIGPLSLDAVAAPQSNAHGSPIAPKVVAPARYKAIPVMPAAEFDLAFLVPPNVTAGAIEATLKQTGGDLLESIVVFDEFRGHGVPEDYRSIAWRLTFRHPERTLNEKEIAARREKLIASVEKQHGVVARTS